MGFDIMPNIKELLLQSIVYCIVVIPILFVLWLLGLIDLSALPE